MHQTIHHTRVLNDEAQDTCQDRSSAVIVKVLKYMYVYLVRLHKHKSNLLN